MSPLLESIFTGVAYDIIKGTLKELFKDDTEELTKRLYKAVDVAMERFDDQYGARFGKAANSFLGRDDNLKLIARSLHFSQPPLASAAFDPRGFDGAPDATEQEISCFLSLLDAEIRNDLFLDKHFREKQQMADTAEVRRDLAEVLDLIRNGVPGFTPSSEAVEDPWESAKIIDLEHPEGWQPEQGQIYTTQSANAAVVRYMLHGPLLGVEYTHPEGWSLYVDVASDGTTHNLRLPHPLSEYSIVIPDDLVVKRESQEVEGGRTVKHVTLKWGNSVAYVLGPDSKLRAYTVKGPSVISHKRRTIEIKPPGHLDRVFRGEA